MMTFSEFKASFSKIYPIQVSASDLGDSYHVDFHGYKNGSLDGIQIIAENGVFEVSEGQAGENQDQLHVFRNYKNLGSAINFVVALSNGAVKPSPIKIY